MAKEILNQVQNDTKCIDNTEGFKNNHWQEEPSVIVGLVVENKIIVGIKAITGPIPDIFKCQILSYLKVGLLVNFGNKSCQVKRFMF